MPRTVIGPDQSSASELWLALKADFPQVSKAPTPTHQQKLEARRSEKSVPDVKRSVVLPTETGQSSRKSEKQAVVVWSSEAPTQAPVIPGTQGGKNEQSKGKRHTVPIAILTAISIALLGIIGILALVAHVVSNQTITSSRVTTITPSPTSTVAIVSPTGTVTAASPETSSNMSPPLKTVTQTPS